MISLGIIVGAIGLLILIVGILTKTPPAALAGKWVAIGGLILIGIGLIILLINRSSTGNELEVDALRSVLGV